MSHLTFRAACAADLPAIMALLVCNKPVFGILLERHVAEDLAYVSHLRRRCWFVAEQDGTVVGSLFCFHAVHDWSYPNYLCISPAAKGQGGGAGLLAMAEAQAKQMGQCGVRFQCPEGNSANALYAKLGYQQTGRERASRNYLINWERCFAA